MFCQNCKTPFQVVPIPEGKQKFCKKCGHFIYKKENNSIIIFHVDEVSNETSDEVELRESINREKELRNKEQLERKQKEEEFRLRVQQERLLIQKEEQRIKEEQEKLFQLQLEEQNKIQKEKEIQEKLLQLEAENAAKIRLEKIEQERLFQIKQEEQTKIQVEKQEREKNLQQELETQRNILKQKEEQEKLLQLELDKQKSLREKLLLEQLEKEKEEIQRIEKVLKEREEKIRLENERIENEKTKLAVAETERLKKEQQFKLEKEKETARINLHAEQKPNRTILVQPNKNNWKKYALPLVAGILITLTFMFLKNKISSFSNSIKSKTVLASADTNASQIDQTYNLDTALLDQLKTNLIGREILSWNTIKQEDLKNITILSGTKSQDNTLYNVAVNLEDKSKTKAVAELSMYYNKIILENIETSKITYNNIAPVNAWFSFAPIENCTISVNTNNNPIQLKFCKDCSITKMVSTKDAPQEIENTSTIFIRSDNKYDAIVEFSYAPIKLNQ